MTLALNTLEWSGILYLLMSYAYGTYALHKYLGERPGRMQLLICLFLWIFSPVIFLWAMAWFALMSVRGYVH